MLTIGLYAKVQELDGIEQGNSLRKADYGVLLSCKGERPVIPGNRSGTFLQYLLLVYRTHRV